MTEQQQRVVGTVGEGVAEASPASAGASVNKASELIYLEQKSLLRIASDGSAKDLMFEYVDESGEVQRREGFAVMTFTVQIQGNVQQTNREIRFVINAPDRQQAWAQYDELKAPAIEQEKTRLQTEIQQAHLQQQRALAAVPNAMDAKRILDAGGNPAG